MIVTKQTQYRGLSNLQKAVRAGAVEMAKDTAAGLYTLNVWQLRHRLRVIALEDIGVANPWLVHRVLAFTRDRRLCEGPDGEIMMSGLAATMAASLKCRAVADCFILKGFGGQPDDTSDLHPIDKRVADFSTRLGDAGFGTAYAEACRLTRHETGEVVTGDPNLTLIDGMLASALDMHCQEGRRCFAYVSKASDAVRRFLESHPVPNKVEAIGLAVFDVEGQIADRLLTTPTMQKLNDQSRRKYSAATTLDFARYEELCEIMKGERPALAKARTRIIDSIAAEAGNPPAQGDLWS